MLTEQFFILAKAGHNFTLWILIALSVISVTLIFERFLSLFSYGQSRNQEKLRSILTQNELSRLEEIATEESIEGRALRVSLKHLRESGPKGLEDMFNGFIKFERPILEKNLNMLATIGSNAPFVGLLGTVFGIMDAFRGLAESQGDAAMVMAGISKALVATAIGLLVALPAVIAYNFFQRRVKLIVQNLEAVKDLCLAYGKNLNSKKDS